MPGLLRGIARTAAIAGTATAVSNRVSRRQAGRWAAQDQRDAFFATPSAPAPAAPAPPPAPAQVASAPALSMDERLAQLTQLAALKEQGVLTEAEFAAQKAQILSS